MLHKRRCVFFCFADLAQSVYILGCGDAWVVVRRFVYSRRLLLICFAWLYAYLGYAAPKQRISYRPGKRTINALLVGKVVERDRAVGAKNKFVFFSWMVSGSSEAWPMEKVCPIFERRNLSRDLISGKLVAFASDITSYLCRVKT